MLKYFLFLLFLRVTINATNVIPAIVAQIPILSPVLGDFVSSSPVIGK
jgi:predicted histidine transporter YuiF (NhaC family)